MKILSSEVQMQSQASQELEFKIHRETSSSFETMVFQPLKPKDEEDIKSSETNNIEEKAIVHDENKLLVVDSFFKYVIEVLMARFLLRGDEDVKIYPNDCCCCKGWDKHMEEQNSRETEPPPQTVIQAKMKFKSEVTTEYYKSNSLSFNTIATIKTADKDINIDLNISYTEEFYEAHKEKLEFEQTVFLDPLVIQYDLSSKYFDSIDREQSFEFDINNDDVVDNIAMLKEGSGFLALDKNSNGTIDNGTELFGTITNNGFDELAVYDEDNNGWIDESDSVFNDLQIWRKNSDGESSMIALGDANVGAIYLSDISSNFNYDKSINQTSAQLKNTSIFLTEDGKAGLVTQVDFAVS